jgi:hypothetical protein
MVVFQGTNTNQCNEKQPSTRKTQSTSETLEEQHRGTKENHFQHSSSNNDERS